MRQKRKTKEIAIGVPRKVIRVNTLYGVARDELRARITADMQAKYGWSITADDIVFLPGVEPGFNMALTREAAV